MADHVCRTLNQHEFMDLLCVGAMEHAPADHQTFVRMGAGGNETERGESPILLGIASNDPNQVFVF